MAMKMVPRTYRIPVELDNGLNRRAAAEGRDKSSVVRDALSRYLELADTADGPPRETGSSQTAGQESADAAVWLAAQIKKPYPVCQGLILAKRVSVGGRRLEGLRVPVAHLNGEVKIARG